MLSSSASSTDRCQPLPLRFPANILTLVLQCLPLTQKFNVLTRICRSFPPLTPTDAIYDTIVLSPDLVAALYASAHLRHLLSSVRGVLLRDDDDSLPDDMQSQQSHHTHYSQQPWMTSPVLFRGLVSELLAGFSRVQCLSLTKLFDPVPRNLLDALLLSSPPLSQWEAHVETDDNDCDLPASPSASPSGVVRFPFLHTLRLTIAAISDRPSTMEMAAHSTVVTLLPLSLLPHLRTLVLEEPYTGIDYSALRFLCSLPLTHLDLSRTAVRPTVVQAEVQAEAVARADIETAAAAVLPVTRTWKILRLPAIGLGVWPSVATMFDKLLHPYMDRGAADGLEYIALATTHPQEALIYVRALQSLRSLEFVLYSARDRQMEGSVDYSPLLTPQLALPNLRHLRLEDKMRQPFTAGTSALSYALLLASYSHQLRVLKISQLSALDNSGLLLCAIAQCAQLRVCALELNISVAIIVDDDPQPQPLLQNLPILPNLHTLRLHLSLHHTDVLVMVQTCSGTLQDLSIRVGSSSMPFSALRAIGLMCPLLRRLDCPLPVSVDGVDICGADECDEKSACVPLFPSLVSLSMRNGIVEEMTGLGHRNPRSWPWWTTAYSHPTAVMVPAVRRQLALAPKRSLPALSLLPPPPLRTPQLLATAQGWVPAPHVQPALIPGVTLTAAAAAGNAQYSHRLAQPGAGAVPHPSALTASFAMQQARMARLMNPPPPTSNTVQRMVDLVRDAPLAYFRLPDAPISTLHLLTPLTQLQALTWHGSMRSFRHPQQYHAATGEQQEEAGMPEPLRQYFIPRTHSCFTQQQPASIDEMHRALVTDELIDDEQPVRDWQLAQEARQESRASQFCFFIPDRVFDGGMNGREAFMAACRELYS